VRLAAAIAELLSLGGISFMGAIQVFLRNEKLPSVETGNEAIKAEGFDLVLDPFDPRTEDCFRPAILKGQETGFEWFLLAVAEIQEDQYYQVRNRVEDCDLRADLDAASPADEEVAAKIAGAVLAKITGGFYLDAEGSNLVFRRGDAAVEVARKAMCEWESHAA
jgi:hypothetical protein